MIRDLIGYITSADDKLMNDVEQVLARLEAMAARWQDEAIRRRDQEASTEASWMRIRIVDLQEALRRDEGGYSESSVKEVKKDGDGDNR